MESGVINSITTYARPVTVNRADPQLADALTRVPASTQTKLRKQSQDFEAMFLNSMFSQMTSGIKGEGPFGSERPCARRAVVPVMADLPRWVEIRARAARASLRPG